MGVFMQQFIESSGGILPACLILVLTMNAVLTGLRTGLEFIQDKTDSKLDNQAYFIVSKACSMLASFVDLLSANKKH